MMERRRLDDEELPPTATSSPMVRRTPHEPSLIGVPGPREGPSPPEWNECGETVIAVQTRRCGWVPWGVLQRCQRALQFTKYGLGIALILCVTVIWVASSEWIQYIFGELEFSKPYFLTYFNTAGFSLWNLGFLLSRQWQKLELHDDMRDQPIFVDAPELVVRDGRDDTTEDNITTTARVTPPPGLPVGTEEVTAAAASQHRDACFDYEVRSSSAESECSMETFIDVPERLADGREVVRRLRVDRVRPYSLVKIWSCAALFCPFWFFANYLFNASLSITSVASNTVLSSTSSVWTLLLSVVLLNQTVGPIRLCAVALCMAGSIMVGLADNQSNSDDQKNTIFGDAIALASAFFYATYTSILKWGLPDDDRYPMGAVFGAVGVVNLVALWPGLVLLHWLGIETFAFPTASQFWPLLLNALIGTNLSDVLWARSVVLTSPVVATLGLSLTTPLAMICDAALKGRRYSTVYIVGAVMVMVGFIVVNLPVRDRWCWSWRNVFNRLRRFVKSGV